VLAAVHGPVAAGPRKENAERAVVEVVFKPRSGLPTSADHELEEVLRATVEGALLAALHPRTLVTVVVQVLQADGALLACAVNAACAALVDAGVPLASLFASVSVALTSGGALLLDPDGQEEADAQAVFSLAYPYRHSLEAAAGEAAAGEAAAGPAAALGAPPQQQQQQQHLEVDEGVLMCHATGRFSTEQLALAMEACRRGCAGIAKFLRMSLLAGFKVRVFGGVEARLLLCRCTQPSSSADAALPPETHAGHLDAATGIVIACADQLMCNTH